jgi:hypothetical protein
MDVIYFMKEIPGGQSSNQYLNVVHFFNASVNYTSVSALNSCFPALVSNTSCSIGYMNFGQMSFGQIVFDQETWNDLQYCCYLNYIVKNYLN